MSTQIKDFMTPMPHTIGVNQTLVQAKKLMHDYNIRHLPVLSQGQLVGIVTDRDVRFAESIKSVDPQTMKIDEVYTPEPYQVHPGHNVLEVCEQMANDKIGCAVVIEHEKVTGIFTWVDALKNIRQLTK